MTERVSACTRCAKPFTDMKVGVELYTSVQRRKADYDWEKIANLDLHSAEIICVECFQVFAEQLKYLNKGKDEKKFSATDIIDVQGEKVDKPIFKDKVSQATIHDSDGIPLIEPTIVYADE